ncbi:Oidioi.mRNA.OKI2018_I69.chr1.g807.t1.cds [Oikopleura dioica]|uniref:Oidioi.mRNA.OKI2018_I69.chr1.g807.t1.cds n=1 Tax=Oikopleura dioica TaxID=34765 RepID=A0ABN7SQ88_OIKDI|nr:Oidioi.mRNA.OKI2018_I69.chr1.g807.t1.cds [Oikopleura dioica]
MKISTFLLATFSQLSRPANADERVFIDEEGFMNIDNKNFKLEEQYLNDELAAIRDMRAKLFFDWPAPIEGMRGTTVKNTINDQFEKLEDRLRSDTAKCFGDFDIAPIEFPDLTSYGGNELINTTMYRRFHIQLARKIAVYIRQVFSTGSSRCTKQQVILMRRLERLRLITLWHYCHRFDSTVPQCSWAYLDNKKNIRAHPRKQAWIEGKYGKNAPFQQRAVVCDIDAGNNDIEQKISCKDDKKLVIDSAVFGRQNGHECLGNFPKGHFSVCSHKEDVKSSISDACEDQTSCSLTTGLIPEENKGFCEDSEKYLLVHYSCEE